MADGTRYYENEPEVRGGNTAVVGGPEGCCGGQHDPRWRPQSGGTQALAGSHQDEHDNQVLPYWGAVPDGTSALAARSGAGLALTVPELGWIAEMSIGQSDFQNCNLVVLKEGLDNWGCYQQALREYFVRRDSLGDLPASPLGARRMQELRREMACFARLATWFRNHLPEVLDPEIRDQLETFHHILKFKVHAWAEFMATGSFSPATLKLSLFFPRGTLDELKIHDEMLAVRPTRPQLMAMPIMKELE